MAFVPVTGVTAVTIDWLHDSQPCVNTFHYNTGDLTSADIVLLCEQVENYVAAHWMGAMGATVGLVRVRGRALNVQFGNEGQWAPAVAVVGLDTSAEMPNNASFAVKRETGKAGRKNRGRIYWISVCTSFLASPNEIKTSAADNIAGHLNGLLSAMAGAPVPGTEVLVNRSTGATVDVTEYVYTDVFVDSQRRRLPGHNIHH